MIVAEMKLHVRYGFVQADRTRLQRWHGASVATTSFYNREYRIEPWSMMPFEAQILLPVGSPVLEMLLRSLPASPTARMNNELPARHIPTILTAYPIILLRIRPHTEKLPGKFPKPTPNIILAVCE
jgi:hypothetical protein